MAILSPDGKSVTVERGDTLIGIAKKYGNGANYKQLAAINNIPNPNLIYDGQVIKLTNTAGSGGSTSSTSTANQNSPTILQFGVQSDSENTLFATWSWSKSNTASYAVLWLYDTGDGVWFVGNDSNISINENAPSVSRQSTYSIPSNANRVKFKVKPISKTYAKNDKETSYWTANWSTEKIYNVSNLPPKVPPVPTVSIKDYTLKATLENLDVNAKVIQFKVVRDDKTTYKTSNTTIRTATNSAAYTCVVPAGSEYKVCCRSVKGNLYSDWSEYSGAVGTKPSAPATITTCRANSETSVYLEWPEVNKATSYDIEYTTKKEYFDGSNQTTTETGIKFAHYELVGLETGQEYFFRVRAVNGEGESAWSGIKSVAIGKDPAAPTTWSSTTTAITGEPLNLYWVHNAEDGSSQTYAELELIIDGVGEVKTIKNTEDEELKDKTSVYPIDTSGYVEGTKIQWRVRTAGVTKAYGDWSVQRTVDIYAPPTLQMSMEDSKGAAISVLEGFPFYVEALAGPNTQAPIGYHVAITAKESYETSDDIGNFKMVNAGDAVYSKYFDITSALLVEFSASNVDLENNIEYTITCTVTMNSGLTTEATYDFSVAWTDVKYAPNAEISIDPETYTAYIRPYCEQHTIKFYTVTESSGTYTKTTETIESVFGEIVSEATTTTGEQVCFGTTADGVELYYCEVDESSLVEDVLLSVYRREFDGSFTELATGLDNLINTSVTDPHPALDYARYRVVATTISTGAVSFYDVPGYPVGGKSVIIQWDEAWSNFDVSEEDLLEDPPWAGSMLKLPYNIDVSNSHSSDVSLVEYIGRKRPVSYYGTQLGETASWNVVIDKSDEETLYAIRRLAIWMGDAYVREPSGTGYWANVKVSFSQKHLDLTIPITFDITRVEGGI